MAARQAQARAEEEAAARQAQRVAAAEAEQAAAQQAAGAAREQAGAPAVPTKGSSPLARAYRCYDELGVHAAGPTRAAMNWG